jgi:hypothetical protein
MRKWDLGLFIKVTDPEGDGQDRMSWKKDCKEAPS